MAWLIAVVSIVCLHHSVSRQFNRCSFFMQLFATATVHPYYCSFGRYLHLQHTLRKRKNKKQQEMKRKKCLWKSQRPGCSFCPKMLGVHRQTFLPDEEAPASLPKHPRGAAPKSSPKRTTVQGTQHFYPNDSAQEFWNIIFRVWLKHVFPFLRPRGSVGREARGTKRERSESPPKRRFVRRTKWWQDRDILPTGQYEEKMCVCALCFKCVQLTCPQSLKCLQLFDTFFLQPRNCFIMEMPLLVNMVLEMDSQGLFVSSLVGCFHCFDHYAFQQWLLSMAFQLTIDFASFRLAACLD